MNEIELTLDIDLVLIFIKLITFLPLTIPLYLAYGAVFAGVYNFKEEQDEQNEQE